MATTKLWHIKGRIKDLMEYVENPEKTVVTDKQEQDFLNVFSYTWNPVKTAGGQYVTAINCQKDIALQQMVLTKKQYGKDDGYIAWHGYQSFKPGEVTPEECHAIGVALAKEMWGDRFQIIVTTHLDRGHLHNHIAFNSVSFRDGGKYNFSKEERQRMRDVSDRLCREHGLSVITNPHKAPSRPVWLDEKAGKPTRYNVYRADIQAAMANSTVLRHMEDYLHRLGYITDFTGKHWKIRLPQYQHFTRLDTLDERWTPDWIMEEIYYRTDYRRERASVIFSPFMPAEYRSYYTPHKPTTHIYKLYLYYCYQLGILPKGKQYHPTSPYLREELRKLDEITAQVDYMGAFHIDTAEDLLSHREELESDIDSLISLRIKLENRIRRASPEEKDALRTEKTAVTAQIQQRRKWLKCNYGIEKRSAHIQETLDRVYDNEQQATRGRKQERSYER